jgi:ribosomal protein S14
MSCTNCGGGDEVEGYTVRFTQGRDEPHEMDLQLCRECVDEFASEGGIDVV